MTANSLIVATKNNKLKIMQLHELKFDKSRSVMVHLVHGKEYPIIKHKGKKRYYIQHAKGQLTVTSVVNKPEREYDIFDDYILSGLSVSHHCHAVTYWCLKYRAMQNITPNDYKIKFGV